MYAAEWAIVTIAISALAGGCATARTPTVPPATPVAKDPAESVRQAVLAGYTGMWTDYGHDLTSHNWQHPTVAAYATGQALLLLEANILSDNHDGVVTEGAPTLYPVVKTVPGVGPSTAEVVDCANFSAVWKYGATTHTRVEKHPDGWHLIDANLMLREGRWKVSTLAMGAVGSC